MQIEDSPKSAITQQNYDVLVKMLCKTTVTDRAVRSFLHTNILVFDVPVHNALDVFYKLGRVSWPFWWEMNLSKSLN